MGEGFVVAELKKPGKHARGAKYNVGSEVDGRSAVFNAANDVDVHGRVEGNPIIYGLDSSSDNDEFLRHRERGNRYMIIVYVIVILTITYFVVGFPSLYHFLYLWRVLRRLLAG